MNYTTVTNLQHTDSADHITMEVKFDAFNSPVPFLASHLDVESHGRELFGRATAGDFGPIADYVAPAQPTE